MWIAFPVLFWPFAFAVYVGLKGRRFGLLPPILLVLFGLFICICGVFRYNPGDPRGTTFSQVHVIVSSLSSAAPAPTPFFLWLATRKDDRWRLFRRFSLVMQVLGLIAALLLALAFCHLIDWNGFAERSFWGVYYIHAVALAVKLRRMKHAIRPPDP
jgi:hypothetical protein